MLDIPATLPLLSAGGLRERTRGVRQFRQVHHECHSLPQVSGTNFGGTDVKESPGSATQQSRDLPRATPALTFGNNRWRRGLALAVVRSGLCGGRDAKES
jgi:hypothetical protein